MYDRRKILSITKEVKTIQVTQETLIAQVEGYEPDDLFVIKHHTLQIYNDNDYSPTPETAEKYWKRGHVEGYAVGYGWLTRGWNFVHYQESGGYIPGGPAVFNVTDREFRRGWVDGWKAGIDQYVADIGYRIGTKSRKKQS